MSSSSPRRGFTLIELLIVIAIISILAVVVFLSLNPAELLKQSRDSSRLSDLTTLNSAISLYSTDQSSAASFNIGSSSVIYVSIPDPVATSTAGDQCQGLGLTTLASSTGYTYHCAASSTYQLTNGTGWLPVNLSAISSGAPLGSLPVDPTNKSSTYLYYTYTPSSTYWELTAVMESQKYGMGGSNDAVSNDGGQYPDLREVGTNLTILPMDVGPQLPFLSSISPNSGFTTYTGSFVIAVNGFNFTPSSTISWTCTGVVPLATIVTSYSSTILLNANVQSPCSVSGTYYLSVTNPNNKTSNSVPFTVIYRSGGF